MSGVGSTNAMKKGSANNPFLAFSEADMSGYLNSAYTGCIVKYSGEAINREVSDINKTVGEYAQNIVFNLQKDGRLGMTAPQAIKIDISNNGSSTTQYIYDAYVKDNKAYPTEITGSVPMLVLAASMDAGADIVAILCDGSGVWQKSAVNDQGKVTLWAYSEDVLFTVVPSAAGSIDIFKQFFTIVPYIVGELYKVVYGNGQYYYEEFYYISEERTTGDSDYIAPGKTMYDFTGSLQTGNGSKVNPYIANTVDEMSSYLTTAYRGAFIKYVGTSTADYTKDAVYQVADDGDTTRYAILPTLSNEGTASDLASGKQLINSRGEVVEGSAGGASDYNELDNIPVINQDLSASDFTPVANTYYRHTGVTTDTFTQGVIYLYDTVYHKLGESGGTIFNKYTLNISYENRYRIRSVYQKAKGRVYIIDNQGEVSFLPEWRLASVESGILSIYATAYTNNSNAYYKTMIRSFPSDGITYYKNFEIKSNSYPSLSVGTTDIVFSCVYYNDAEITE